MVTQQQPRRVVVDESRHFRSHMVAPRGRGGWMFENQAGDQQFTVSGTFAEARRGAVAEAQSRGWDVVFVCP